jgi:ethanolamine utilization microcompartment shell protein EutS
VAGLGLREIAAIGLLVPLGFGEAQAIGFSILISLATSVIIGLIGGFSELLRLTGRR